MALKTSSASFLILAALSVFFLGSCATTKSFDAFPRKMIDRPYTMPGGINAWRTFAGGSYGIDADGKSQILYPFPVPLFWEQSLAEDWALLWTVIPFGVSHQVVRDANGYIGVQAGLLPAYQEVLGWGVSPALFNENFSKLSENFALVYGGGVQSTLYFSGGPLMLSGDVSVAPIYQLTPTMAVAVRPDLKFTYNSDFSATKGKLAYSTSERLCFELPIQSTVRWSASRQWDINIDHAFHYLGLSNGAYSHEITLSLIHFW